MKKVLVTGSNGKLGREVFRASRTDYKPVGIDLEAGPYTHIVADIRKRDAVNNVLKGIEAVVHTAALHGKHTDLNYSRDAFVATNIEGTLNLLNGCVKHGISKFVYTDTTSIYGLAMVNPRQAV